MADNLESYFKKHLSKASPGDDNWNVPSDDVWEKVLPEISKKKGLFIPWKYLYILAFIVMAGLAFLLWPGDEMDPSFTETDEKITSERNPVHSPVDNATQAGKDANNTKQEMLQTENPPNQSGLVSNNTITPKNQSQTTEISTNQSKNYKANPSGQNVIQYAPSQNNRLHELPLRTRDQIEIAFVLVQIHLFFATPT